MSDEILTEPPAEEGDDTVNDPDDKEVVTVVDLDFADVDDIEDDDEPDA